MKREDPEIGRELFGYKKEDVDLILAELHRNLRAAKEESATDISEIETIREKLKYFEGISDKLRSALSDADKTSDLMIRQAKSEAEEILNSAYHAASQIVAETESDKKRIGDALCELDEADRQLHDKFQAILNSYLSLVKAVSNTDGAKPEVTGEQSNRPSIHRHTPDLNCKLQENANKKSDGDLDLGVLSNRSLSAAEVAILKTHMAPIIEVDGIVAAWLFDSTSNMLAHVAKPDIPADDLVSTLKDFSSWAYYLATRVGAPEITMAFVQLKELVFLIQPVEASTAIGVIASNDANLVSMFSTIAERRAKLSEVITSINLS